MARYAAEARAAPSVPALMHVVTQLAENYVTPKFWAVGMVAQSPKEVAALATLAATRRQTNGTTVCEVGFNAGHSAHIWLRQIPNAHLHIFDLLGLPHSRASAAFLHATHPRRATFHVGDSITTIARYARQVANGTSSPCDLWFIDGAHTGDTPRLDLEHALASARPGAVVVADDVTVGWFAVKRPWDALIKTRRLRDELCDEQILCAKGRRRPATRKGGRGVWMGDVGPPLPCDTRPRCVPRNDDTTRCFKKRWCAARIP